MSPWQQHRQWQRQKRPRARVTGYAKDTMPPILDMLGSASRASPKTTPPNPLDTSMTPPRSTKKQRVTGTTKHDYDFSTAESTAAVSSLTASESQRLIDLETQVKSLQEGAAPFAAQDMGEMLKRVLTAMFPNQEAYTAAIFHNYGYSPDEPISPPRSPPQLNPPPPPRHIIHNDGHRQPPHQRVPSNEAS